MISKPHRTSTNQRLLIAMTLCSLLLFLFSLTYLIVALFAEGIQSTSNNTNKIIFNSHNVPLLNNDIPDVLYHLRENSTVLSQFIHNTHTTHNNNNQHIQYDPHRRSAHILLDKAQYRLNEKVHFSLYAFHLFDHVPATNNIYTYTRYFQHPQPYFYVYGPKGDTVLEGKINLESANNNNNDNNHPSSVGGTFLVDPSWSGGSYVICVADMPLSTDRYKDNKSVCRNFIVRSNYALPLIDIDSQFMKKSYSLGDLVEIKINTKRTGAGGSPSSNGQCTINIMIDGANFDYLLKNNNFQLDDNGYTFVSFYLPSGDDKDKARITRGEGSITITIIDGSLIETKQMTIPIVTDLIPLKLYSFIESGQYIIPEISNTIYFQAYDKNNEPAEVTMEIIQVKVNDLIPYFGSAGRSMNLNNLTSFDSPRSTLLSLSSPLLDSHYKVIASGSTLHEGRNRLTFTPDKSIIGPYTSFEHDNISDHTQLFLRIVSPKTPLSPYRLYTLPSVSAKGMFISSLKHIYSWKDDKIDVLVNVRTYLDNNSNEYKVILSMKDEPLSATSFIIPSAQSNDASSVFVSSYPISLPVSPSVYGVLTLTVYDQNYKPVAERLIYRNARQHLNISVMGVAAAGSLVPLDKMSITPGSNVTLRIKTKINDLSDNSFTDPIRSLLRISVTDAGDLNLLEERKRPPRLISSVLLENEICNPNYVPNKKRLDNSDYFLFQNLVDTNNEDEPKKGLVCGEFTDSNVYLSPYEPEFTRSDKRISSSEALDLLLGTQGWRIFAFYNPANFITAYGAIADRLIVNIPLSYDRCQYNNHCDHLTYGETYNVASVAKMFFQDNEGDQFRAFAAAPRVMMMADMKGAPLLLNNENVLELNQVEDQNGGVNQIANHAEQKGNIVENDLGGVMAPKMNKKIAADHFIMRRPHLERNPHAHHQQKSPFKYERVYAHQILREHNKGPRRDFTDTIFFSSGITTKASNDLNDKNKKVADSSQDHLQVGEVEISFSVNDAITQFRLMIDGYVLFQEEPTSQDHDNEVTKREIIATSGIFGSYTNLLTTISPFYLNIKAPNQVTQGDRIHLPILIFNQQMEHNLLVKLKVLNAENEEAQNNEKALISFPSMSQDLTPFQIPHGPNSFVRRILELHVSQTSTGALVSTPLFIQAHGEIIIPGSEGLTSGDIVGSAIYSDELLKSIRVIPRGFPVFQNSGGYLRSSTHNNNHAVKNNGIVAAASIPLDAIEGSVRVNIKLYPTPAANIIAALEALIREPCGCFEQTSSTTYPLVMAQQYFKMHSKTDGVQKLMDRAHEMLEKGYKRLISYETSTSGFDWFGQSPAHEALTAYGLVQFIDMAKVMPSVDMEPVIARTKSWLLSRANEGNVGGFQRNERALDSFGKADTAITDAYIIWSLTYAGIFKDNDSLFRPHIDHLLSLAKKSNDAYLLALIAGTLYNINQKEKAFGYAEQLISSQRPDGSVLDSRTSITSSEGQSLVIETTSLAVLVWLNNPTFTTNVENAIRYIISACQDGRFGSTQGTVLSLKALIAYDASRSSNKVPGKLNILLNGKHMETEDDSSITIKGNELDVININTDKLTKAMKPSEEDYIIQLKLEDGSDIPYSIQVIYNTPKPPSCSDCDLSLSVSLPSLNLLEGDGSQIEVSVKNLKDSTSGMVTAVVGIPNGLQVPSNSLQELIQSGLVSFAEESNLGNEILLYWRSLKKFEEKRLLIPVIANIPGTFIASPSRAYNYYNDQNKIWSPQPLQVQIKPKI